MTDPRDDDALSWDGDDDPTLAPGWERVGAAVPVTPQPEVPAGGGGATEAPIEEQRDAAGSFALVLFGVFGGIYLLYTIGWILTAMRSSAPGTSVVADFMYQFGLWAAVFAAPAWFGVSAWLTRSQRARMLWLLLGAIVLVPLPFVLGEIR